MYPTLFRIGPIPVRSFGVMVLIGFLLALWYAMSAARRRMAGRKPDEPGVITPDHVFDMSIVCLFVSILGARILYVLLDLREFQSRSWTEFFKIWTGGISVHGAIISGALYLWWYCRRHKLAFLEFADLCAPAFALGYAIGRVGCFLNGCCYGHACDLPWAVQFLRNGEGSVLTPPSHPAQLYATALNLVWFIVLDRWSRRPHRRGEIFLAYLAMYAVYRFIVEIFRIGASAEAEFWIFSSAQVLSLAALPIIGFFWWRIRRAPLPQATIEPATSG